MGGWWYIFLGEFPKGIPFLFIYQKDEGNLIIGMPRVGGFIKHFFSLQFLSFLFFLAAPHGMWDLSFPTRDWTSAPALEAQSLNHWTAREVPIKPFFKALKALLSGSFHKIGSGLLLLSKTYRDLAIREKFGIHFWQWPTSLRKPHHWCLLWIPWNLGNYEVYLDLCVTHVLISDALNIEPGFGQTAIFLWRPYVPSRLKALGGGCYLPLRRLEKESKEANHPHTASSEGFSKGTNWSATCNWRESLAFCGRVPIQGGKFANNNKNGLK